MPFWPSTTKAWWSHLPRPRRLGFRHNPPDAVAATRDKSIMRERLEVALLPQPAYRIVALGADVASTAAEIGYPCVVKPVSRSASQGVIRVDDSIEAEAAAVRIRAMTASSPEPLLVESFVPGDEVAVEGLLTGGRLAMLAVFDKPDRLDGPFFEETIYVTPSCQPPAILTEIEFDRGSGDNGTRAAGRTRPCRAAHRPGWRRDHSRTRRTVDRRLVRAGAQVRSGREPRGGDRPARPRHGARWPHPGIAGIGGDDAPHPLGGGTRPRVGTGARSRPSKEWSVSTSVFRRGVRWCHCPKVIATWGSSSPVARHRSSSKRLSDRQRHVSTCTCGEQACAAEAGPIGSKWCERCCCPPTNWATSHCMQLRPPARCSRLVTRFAASMSPSTRSTQTMSTGPTGWRSPCRCTPPCAWHCGWPKRSGPGDPNFHCASMASMHR